MLLKEERFLEIITSGNLFGYVQCDIGVPENLREAFANFQPILKNNFIGRDDIGPLMMDYAEKKGLLTQPSTLLKSSYFLENDRINLPMLFFYLDLGLVCKNVYEFVPYTLMKCFTA